MKYIVKWESKVNREVFGQMQPMDKELADNWAASGNASFPHLKHWVEKFNNQL